MPGLGNVQENIMELDEIRSLIDMLKDTDVTELQIEGEGSKLRIKREKYMVASDQSSAAAPSVAPETRENSVNQPPDKNMYNITSPIVGIFHRSPSPESAPFVDIGSIVRKGQVMCIVEAMKLMNEIESDTDGTVARILVENGQPVEYGEPLFLIEPA